MKEIRRVAGEIRLEIHQNHAACILVQGNASFGQPYPEINDNNFCCCVVWSCTGINHYICEGLVLGEASTIRITFFFLKKIIIK